MLIPPIRDIRVSFSIALLSIAGSWLGGTTIDPANRFAYSANAGWIDAGDSSQGLNIGQAYCTGYLYTANLGWIDCGQEKPENGTGYGNDSATDYGINHDGNGNLSGMAYGANVGWIIFEPTYGNPKVNLLTGELSGFIWSVNCGWIDLGSVKTTTVLPGDDDDFDGIPDPWELAHASGLGLLGNWDSDGDGVSDVDEYEGGTNPLDSLEYIRIIDIQSAPGQSDFVTWTCTNNRVFSLVTASSIDASAEWTYVGEPFIPSDASTVEVEVVEPIGPRRFYRVIVVPPLLP